ASEPALALPLRIVGPDGRALYESPAWPVNGAAKDAFFATHVLAVPGQEVYVLQAVKNDEILYARIEQTRYAVFLTTAAVTLLFVLIAVAFLEYVVISPLRSLIEQLRAQSRDESQVGRRVEVHMNSDVVELAARFNDMTGRLEHLYENVERMAFTDPLTQLPNRMLMQERLEQAIAAAHGDNRTFALFIMDLDRFKEINDTLGHNVGDLLLQQVAVRLRAKLRESDTIARMGGDEFAVLLPTETAKQADTAARMLLQSLRAPFVIGAHQLDVRVSVGVALYPDHGVDAHTLIQRADIAMYAAKRSSAGHMFYDPHMDRHHPAQLTLMGELRQAVDHEQFVLYYQPKIGLRSNRVVGLEALVRWRHPSGKLIMPETFIPLLEQTGLIRSLTGWVTHEALGMARELREQGFELPIAVNISARDLLNNSLVEDLAEQLGAHDAFAHWLELEITESTVMSDIASAMGLLAQLSGMGFKLVIDDFGTGYSSLAYLKRLPVQAVKIDKSFVMGMVKDENDAAIVYTSIELCHNLGLQVIAEGVDDEAALQRLRAHGCDAAQGIYLSRPLPAPELFEWLEKSSWGLRPQRAAIGS
ncbi:MAG TPA: EAL domain-containing protein, partial [Burkholderiales bacterium]